MMRWTAPLVAIGVSLSVVVCACASAHPDATIARHHAKHKRQRLAAHHVRHHVVRASGIPLPFGIGGTGTSGSTQSSPETVAARLATLREVSYYPARHPWGGMWFDWYPSVINNDMAKLASLGVNTVRIFIQPATFGYPTPQLIYTSRLQQVVTMAANHGLRVHLTLFDLWSNYSDVSNSERWAAQLLAPYRGDSRIACVELQNEIDPDNSQAMSWARTLLPAIRSDSGVPVTVSVTGWNTATPLAHLVSALGSVKPDFYDLHFYGTPPYMTSTFQAAKQAAGGTPLLIGETGYSTDPSNTSWLGTTASASTQEQKQAEYMNDVEESAKSVGLPLVGIWNMNDFPPLKNVTPIEQHFGLYRLDGSAKPATAAVKSEFGR